MLPSIDAAAVDKLYKKLLPLRDEAGNPVPQLLNGSSPHVTSGEPLYAERRTTVNHAMKSCRTAWNIVRRLHPKDVPAANPFAEMGLVSRTKPVEAATYGDLLAAVAQADAMGLPSLGTALAPARRTHFHEVRARALPAEEPPQRGADRAPEERRSCLDPAFRKENRCCAVP
jgi:hypothetical protein